MRVLVRASASVRVCAGPYFVCACMFHSLCSQPKIPLATAASAPPMKPAAPAAARPPPVVSAAPTPVAAPAAVAAPVSSIADEKARQPPTADNARATQNPAPSADPQEEMCAFLNRIGLSDHYEPFKKQGLDMRSLLECTDEEIKELPNLGLGHRKTLLRELKALSASGAAATHVATDPWLIKWVSRERLLIEDLSKEALQALRLGFELGGAENVEDFFRICAKRVRKQYMCVSLYVLTTCMHVIVCVWCVCVCLCGVAHASLTYRSLGVLLWCSAQGVRANPRQRSGSLPSLEGCRRPAQRSQGAVGHRGD